MTTIEIAEFNPWVLYALTAEDGFMLKGRNRRHLRIVIPAYVLALTMGFLGAHPEAVVAQAPGSPNEFAYVSSLGDLLIGTAGSRDAHRIVAGPVMHPVWSHSGESIAFIRNGDPAHAKGSQVEIVNADGSGHKVIVTWRQVPANLVPRGLAPEWQHSSRIRWSLDDSALYFAWTYGTVSGHGINLVSVSTLDEQNLGIYADDFDVTAHGEVVATAYDNTVGGSVLFLTEPGTGGAGATLAGGSANSRISLPTVSPDGSRVGFFSENGVEIVGIDGTSLGSQPAKAVSALLWSPDGQSLIFKKPDLSAWALPLNGGEPVATSPEGGLDMAWRPITQPRAQPVAGGSNPLCSNRPELSECDSPTGDENRADFRAMLRTFLQASVPDGHISEPYVSVDRSRFFAVWGNDGGCGLFSPTFPCLYVLRQAPDGSVEVYALATGSDLPGGGKTGPALVCVGEDRVALGNPAASDSAPFPTAVTWAYSASVLTPVAAEPADITSCSNLV